MPTGIRGVKLIEKWEGLYLKAYQDSVGIWTIGWGTITAPHLGIKVYPGLVIDREQAEKWLQIELREKEAGVEKLVKVPLTQYQYDTLVSFTYNVGTGALQKSTLLKLLNRGNYDAVPGQLMRWTKAGGRELKGLVNRRRDEARLWRNEHIDAVPDTDIVRVNKTLITPKTADKPLIQTIGSRTGGAVIVQTGAAAATAGHVAMTTGACAATGLALGGLLVVGGIGGYVLYRKYLDTREMR